MINLSATIITLNEARGIEACLASLDFCDEIVLVDSGSTDGTVDLARKYTDRIFHQPFLGDGPQKNKALSLARGRWLFQIDGDEVVGPELAREIRGTIDKHGTLPKENRPGAYSISRKNYIGSTWVRHGGWFPDYQIRLWPAGQAAYKESQCHAGVVVNGQVARLGTPLEHYTYETVAAYQQGNEHYARTRAQDYFDEGRVCRPWTPFIHQLTAVVKTYLLQAGFLDGRLGLSLAWSAGIYTRRKYLNLKEMNRQLMTGREAP